MLLVPDQQSEANKGPKKKKKGQDGQDAMDSSAKDCAMQMIVPLSLEV